MEKESPINILYLTGGDDKYHPFDQYSQVIEAFLIKAGCKVTVTRDHDYLLPGTVKDYDVIISLTTNFYLQKEHEDSLLKAIIGNPWGNTGKPKGFIGLHSATISYLNSPAFTQMIGAKLLTHPPLGSFHYQVANREHPVMQGVEDFTIESELYLMETYPPFEVLLTSEHLGFTRPIAWVKPYGKGRIFYCSIGHQPEEFQNDSVQKMIINAVKWSVKDT